MVHAVTFDAGDTLLQRRIFPPDRWFGELCRLAGITVSAEAALEAARARKRYEEAHRPSRFAPVNNEWIRARNLAGLRAAGIVGDMDERLERIRQTAPQIPSGWALDPDVPGVLDALHQRGILLGVVSNWNSVLRRDLESLGIARYFAAITDSETAGVDKPDARIYEITCERLNVQPDECMHIGDSPRDDVGMARAVGATPVLYDPLECLECDCLRIPRLIAVVDQL